MSANFSSNVSSQKQSSKSGLEKSYKRVSNLNLAVFAYAIISSFGWLAINGMLLMPSPETMFIGIGSVIVSIVLCVLSIGAYKKYLNLRKRTAPKAPRRLTALIVPIVILVLDALAMSFLGWLLHEYLVYSFG